MHGGTIEAASSGSGQGRRSLRLPTMAAQAERHGLLAEPPSRAVFGTDLPSLHGVRVLAVDDEPDALTLITEILEAAGAQVSVAQSATEAIGAVQIECPDVLIADLGMPRVDGFALIARIRASNDKSVRDLPAAALTAYARSEDRARALRSGFQIHLAKPIDPTALITAIGNLTNRTADAH
jgi:CheY-like chemotaxis protein